MSPKPINGMFSPNHTGSKLEDREEARWKTLQLS